MTKGQEKTLYNNIFSKARYKPWEVEFCEIENRGKELNIDRDKIKREADELFRRVMERIRQ